ncbi:MAG: response regulator, partial [Candidatus Omnitrophica bacterium]|nr:response regulator [Candidatus Omnitrophota bacterium]
TYLIKPVSRVDMVNVLAKSSGYVKSEVRKPKEIKPLTKEDEAKFENIKILVAENNPSNLKLIESFLSKLKCKVDYVYNGEEAVRKLEANKYNLCLMDLQMPILGGIEAAKKIRKRISKSLPIIALTAAVLKEDRIKAEEAGMNDFLDKPIDMVKLKEKILQYGTKEIEPEESQKEKRKIKALVVDDNVLNMKLLVALLKKSDCESDTAEDGKIAVEKAKSNEYDICFMDIQMPVMGGVEATKIIREEVSKDLPVIAVTAVKDFTLEKSLDAEMNGCIHKPIDINMLKKILAEYCPLV